MRGFNLHHHPRPTQGSCQMLYPFFMLSSSKKEKIEVLNANAVRDIFTSWSDPVTIAYSLRICALHNFFLSIKKEFLKIVFTILDTFIPFPLMSIIFKKTADSHILTFFTLKAPNWGISTHGVAENLRHQFPPL